MTDTERHDAAMRWLARNVAWSRSMEVHRAPTLRRSVLVALATLDHENLAHDRTHDRVA